MAGKTIVNCAKCGISSKDNSSLTFHRFPLPSMHGTLKARVWAKFCFPDKDWKSNESLENLYKQHKMLCGNHFDDSSFTSSERKRLNKFAIPIGAQNLLDQLRDEQCNPPSKARETQYRSPPVTKDVMASTSQCEQNLQSSDLIKYGSPPVTDFMASTSQCEQNLQSSDLIKKSCSKGILEELNVKKIIELTPLHINHAKLNFNYRSPPVTKDVMASTSQCEQNLQSSDLIKYGSPPVTDFMASTSQCEQNLQSSDLIKKSCSKGILEELNVKKIIELTPRKLKLYKRCRKNLNEILRLRKKFNSVNKNNRNILSSLQTNNAVNSIIKSKLGSSFYLLLQSQLKNVPRKLTGRRWTLDDKVLALSVYKKSSSCYRLLSRLFCLPSVSSLKALLNKIPMVCGINNQVIQTIANVTRGRPIEENVCVLAFDEMSIRKNLTYNSKLDQFDGYQDHAGQGRTQEIASHALTFMAIGIRKKWKQPVAFYFSGDCVTADRLAVLIKEVLSACFGAGLEVIGVVSDLDGVNIRAINSLGSTKDRSFFNHEGHEIVTILDPPHLLKCFRNNFLKHDIQFTQDVQLDGQPSVGVAKWSHIEEFYNIDNKNPNFVFAPALTQQHLNPNGKQKMKVKLAAQVLSHSVAAGLYAKVSQNELPQDAIGTATIISNMDNLFDAMNGDTPDRKRGKPYLTNMSSTSPHLELFKKMKKILSELKFLGSRSKPPSQEGWLRTLNAIEKIFYNLKKYNIRTLSVRRLNQDPLENCFGCIRSNCGCNPNPTSVQFIAALKTSIITNLINNNKNRNCLDDNNDLLNNFKVFLHKGCEKTTFTEQKRDDDVTSTPSENVMSMEGVEECDLPQCSGEMQACAYVCGFIAKNIAMQCEECKKTVLADPNTEVCHIFTSFKEYSDVSNSLKYIQPSFCLMVENAANIINNFLKENSHTDKITQKLRKMCDALNKDWLKGCEEHQQSNFYKIINSTIAICIKRFSILKNRGYVEEASKKSLLRKINILKNV